MDKIEKMSGYSEVTMKLKINEIIDYLNQSQKQPEIKSDAEEAIDLCVDMAFTRNKELEDLEVEPIKATEGIKKTRVIHEQWLEFERISPKTQIFGKYQYLFSRGNEVFSVIRIKNPLTRKFEWEVVQVEGESGYSDMNKFTTLREAEGFVMRRLSKLKVKE